MAKIHLATIGSGYNVGPALNANNAAIEEAFDNTISRDGTSPNSMEASLDMNSHPVVNVGAPTAGTDAARFIDITDAVELTGTAIPALTGNSGKYITTDGTSLAFDIPRGYIPITPREISAGVTARISDYSKNPGDVLRYGYVADGIDGTDTGTDNTQAIQDAIDSSDVVLLPEGVGQADWLQVGYYTTFKGVSERSSILRQLSTSVGGPNGGFLEFDALISTDITDGPRKFDSLCIKANADCHGIYIPASQASMLSFENVRLWNQHQETIGAVPYTVPTGKYGIYFDGNIATNTGFMVNTRNLEIRSFDEGIYAIDTNEWFLHGWILDCARAIHIDGCSTWNFSGVTVESGVSNARVLYAENNCSNIICIGGRHELTQAGAKGVEGAATLNGSNWRIGFANNLIAGDGSAIPGNKWTGTLPDDFIWYGSDNYDGSLKPFEVIPNQVRKLMPNLVRMGGTAVGDGKLTLGRNAGGADASIENTATGRCTITGSNSVDVVVGSTITGRFDDSATATHTRLLVYDVDNGILERVTVGAADSGGAGFKVLRIPN